MMMDLFFLKYTLRIGVLSFSAMISLFMRGLGEVITGFSASILMKHYLIDSRKDYCG